jgi:hypothetical protein
MSYTITLDPYTVLNLINAAITTVIIFGCLVWLFRFTASAIEHKDKIGLFLVVLALMLLVVNVIALSLQVGQALGMTDYRVHFAVLRLLERVLSLTGMALLFVCGKHQYE